VNLLTLLDTLHPFVLISKVIIKSGILEINGGNIRMESYKYRRSNMNNSELGNNSSTTEQFPFSGVGQLWATYLYNHPEVRERVQSLRKQQGFSPRNHIEDEMTDFSKDVFLMAKLKRIKVLEAEVKFLKDQVKRLGCKIYDAI